MIGWILVLRRQLKNAWKIIINNLMYVFQGYQFNLKKKICTKISVISVYAAEECFIHMTSQNTC